MVQDPTFRMQLLCVHWRVTLIVPTASDGSWWLSLIPSPSPAPVLIACSMQKWSQKCNARATDHVVRLTRPSDSVFTYCK